MILSICLPISSSPSLRGIDKFFTLTIHTCAVCVWHHTDANIVRANRNGTQMCALRFLSPGNGAGYLLMSHMLCWIVASLFEWLNQCHNPKMTAWSSGSSCCFCRHPSARTGRERGRWAWDYSCKCHLVNPLQTLRSWRANNNNYFKNKPTLRRCQF